MTFITFRTMVVLLFAVVATYSQQPLQGTIQQTRELVRLRDAWASATPSERLELRKQLAELATLGAVDAGRAQEQLGLWDACCTLWDVVPTAPPKAHSRTQRVGKQIVSTPCGPMPYADNVSVRASRDSMWFTSSSWPGYGGKDIYVSSCHFYPVQRVHRWLEPTNLGLGLNSEADEELVALSGPGLLFERTHNGKTQLLFATPRAIVQSISIASNNVHRPVIIATMYNCKNDLCASIGFDNRVAVAVPADARTIHIRCCWRGEPRVFNRCDIPTRQLALTENDVRTHDCFESAGITTHDAEHEYSISVYEDELSAQQALNRIREICEQGKPKVVIHAVPGHIELAIQGFVRTLQSIGVHVQVDLHQSERTVIALLH